MQIDRSNYEIWLIDWLDGNLNDLQIEQLQLFLKENPDIEEESEELTIFRLNSSEASFPHKNKLRKTIADLTESNLEYLSIAYLEDDLSAEEQTELLETIKRNREKKVIFESIQRTRLIPYKISFRHKNRLLKRTLVQNALRWSFIGLSAAAIVTLVIITSVSTPHELNINTNKTAQTVSADSAVKNQSAGVVEHEIKADSRAIPHKTRSKVSLAATLKPDSSVFEIRNNPLSESDSTLQSSTLAGTIINKIYISSPIEIKGEPLPNTLIALNPSVIVQEYDDGRSKLSRFIAKTFREKILKENKAKDSPLKAYELAKAGVTGLDKLLGWEMALDEKKDTNGVLKSVYFSSKILKFNAPIKKTEPLP